MTIRVVLIPALQDNYQHLIICEKTREAAIVDPADADSVLAAVQKEGVTLKAIFNTHHHWDHTQGNEGLCAALKLPVYCSAYDQNRIAHASHPLREGDTVAVGAARLQVLDIPGHTLGHIAFFGEDCLFCGDTLFGAGCGRLFEGSPKQMLDSLHKLMQLPVDTKVYCGHEYTLNNLLFAKLVEPGNPDVEKKLEETRALRRAKKPTLPTLLKEELSYNPFLRAGQPLITQSLKANGFDAGTTELEVFTAVREWKNQF